MRCGVARRLSKAPSWENLGAFTCSSRTELARCSPHCPFNAALQAGSCEYQFFSNNPSLPFQKQMLHPHGQPILEFFVRDVFANFVLIIKNVTVFSKF